jgi:hypothetical protein
MFKLLGLIRVLAHGQALALLLIAGAALAEDKEPLAIFELGAAGEWGFNSGSSRAFSCLAESEGFPCGSICDSQ